MIKFITESYSILLEIIIILSLVSAVILGFHEAGILGALIGLLITFALCIITIGPIGFLIECRDSLQKIELALEAPQKAPTRREPPSLSGTTLSDKNHPVTVMKKPGQIIKSYEGKTIIKEEVGVSVDGVRFSGLLAAEKSIRRNALAPQDDERK